MDVGVNEAGQDKHVFVGFLLPDLQDPGIPDNHDAFKNPLSNNIHNISSKFQILFLHSPLFFWGYSFFLLLCLSASANCPQAASMLLPMLFLTLMTMFLFSRYSLKALVFSDVLCKKPLFSTGLYAIRLIFTGRS